LALSQPSTGSADCCEIVAAAGRLSTNLAQRIVGLPEAERKKCVGLVKTGDKKGAKAKLTAKLAPRSEGQNPKSKTASTKAKVDPKKSTKPGCNGLPAVYAGASFCPRRCA